MREQAFDRRKNTLAILVVFLVVISMTATVVSAADGMHDHHQGEHGDVYYPDVHRSPISDIQYPDVQEELRHGVQRNGF
jgi:hypothetical protein